MIGPLKQKLETMNLGIRGKLLIPTVATLVVAIIGLSVALLTVQQRLNGGMRQEIEKTLVSANSEIRTDLEGLKEDIGSRLKSMAERSGAALSRATTKALDEERSSIERNWESMMQESGESIAFLMARVAPNAILGKDFQSLNSFVKAALQNPNVIYAFYFRKDGNLLTRYIDRTNDKIKTYMKAEGKNRYAKILNGAKNDTSVMIVHKSIQFEGDVLGSVEICIDKTLAANKINDMAGRFSQLVKNNQALSLAVIQTEAEKVNESVGVAVSGIIGKNGATAETAVGELKKSSTTMGASIKQIVIAGGAACIVMVISILILIIQRVIKPLNQTLLVVKDIAEGEGDLTIRLDVNGSDEVSQLSKWFNIFLDKLQGVVKDIAATAGALGESSDTLSGLSGKLSEGATHMSGLSSSVASASEEMSANMNVVAGSSSESASKVNMVASAAKEMTTTINEIAKKSENARTISKEAVAQASETTKRMEKLREAANSIGNVTQTIADISDQTNLLALNATIEAARAGDVGKGFAVVANEIKELAKQTAGATQEIRNQIEGIQGSTSETIDQIDKISEVIHNINGIVSGIAAAVDEQSSTTKEIAGNVGQASQGMQDVNENVAQSSIVSGEIAREIAGVNEFSNQLSGNSDQMNQSAASLSQLANELNALVDKFKYEQ